MCSRADEAFLKQSIATLQTKPRSDCSELAPGEFFLTGGVRFDHILTQPEVVALATAASHVRSREYELVFIKVGEVRGGTTFFVTLLHK